VLAEAEAPGYVERRDGRLWLTVAGDGLFRDGSSEPQIFAVEPRRREVGFDLIIACAPASAVSHRVRTGTPGTGDP